MESYGYTLETAVSSEQALEIFYEIQKKKQYYNPIKKGKSRIFTRCPSLFRIKSTGKNYSTTRSSK
jgi:hypothetical protein